MAGSITDHHKPNSEQPSMRAASSISLGHPEKLAAVMPKAEAFWENNYISILIPNWTVKIYKGIITI
jgi:hypothetical protein